MKDLILDEFAIFLRALFERVVFVVIGILLFKFLGIFGAIGFLVFLMIDDWRIFRKKFYS